MFNRKQLPTVVHVLGQVVDGGHPSHLQPMDLRSTVPGQTDPIGKQPIREQIRAKLTYMINHGLLRPGDELGAQALARSTLSVHRLLSMPARAGPPDGRRRPSC